MEKQKNSGMPIVASHYGNKTGTPALFHKTIFPALLKLLSVMLPKLQD